MKNGRDRFASGHAGCASRLFLEATLRGRGVPQRSAEWMVNGTDDESLGIPAIGRHSLAILADSPEVDPCLSAISDRQSTNIAHASAIYG
jgi:hypothetical protein